LNSRLFAVHALVPQCTEGTVPENDHGELHPETVSHGLRHFRSIVIRAAQRWKMVFAIVENARKPPKGVNFVNFGGQDPGEFCRVELKTTAFSFFPIYRAPTPGVGRSWRKDRSGADFFSGPLLDELTIPQPRNLPTRADSGKKGKKRRAVGGRNWGLPVLVAGEFTGVGRPKRDGDLPTGP